MRLMYDAVNWQAIPQDSQLVAGYVDGRLSKWPDQAWYAFPGKIMVRIAVLPTTNDGVVLDVEPGDAEPQDVPGWLAMRRAAGIDPTVYCSPQNVAIIRAYCQQAGVTEPHWWIADPDDDPTLPEGAVAKQYNWGPKVDRSVVADYWPGVDPLPPRNAEFVLEEDTVEVTALNPDETLAANEAIYAEFSDVAIDQKGGGMFEVSADEAKKITVQNVGPLQVPPGATVYVTVKP